MKRKNETAEVDIDEDLARRNPSQRYRDGDHFINVYAPPGSVERARALLNDSVVRCCLDVEVVGDAMFVVSCREDGALGGVLYAMNHVCDRIDFPGTQEGTIPKILSIPAVREIVERLCRPPFRQPFCCLEFGAVCIVHAHSNAI
jgi:hypothetical protein